MTYPGFYIEEWVENTRCSREFLINQLQAPVVQKVDSAIQWINHYPVDSTVGFVNAYPVDSDLSGR